MVQGQIVLVLEIGKGNEKKKYFLEELGFLF